MWGNRTTGDANGVRTQNGSSLLALPQQSNPAFKLPVKGGSHPQRCGLSPVRSARHNSGCHPNQMRSVRAVLQRWNVASGGPLLRRSSRCLVPLDKGPSSSSSECQPIFSLSERRLRARRWCGSRPKGWTENHSTQQSREPLKLSKATKDVRRRRGRPGHARVKECGAGVLARTMDSGTSMRLCNGRAMWYTTRRGTKAKSNTPRPDQAVALGPA